MKVRSHAAFDNLLSISGSAIFEAFVLSRKNVSRDGRLTYLPLYMPFCLAELVERKKTMRPISGLLPLRSTLAPRPVTTLPACDDIAQKIRYCYRNCIRSRHVQGTFERKESTEKEELMRNHKFFACAFAGLVALALTISLSGCDSSRLPKFGQSQTTESQDQKGGQGSKKAMLDAPTKAVTLDGDLSRVVVGVWDMDSASGSKTMTRGDYLDLTENKTGTLTWTFKDDGTLEIDNFRKQTSFKWKAKDENTISFVGADGNEHEYSYDRATHLLSLADEVTTHMRKVSDDPSDLSNLTYVKGKLNNVGVWLPGSYAIVSIDYSDPSQTDLDEKGVAAAGADSGLSYNMSIRTNGDSALFALEYVYGMQVAVENPSADGRTYPVYIQGTNGKLSDEGTISIDPENERIVILKVPQYTIKFVHTTHNPDNWSYTKYPPKAENPWDKVSDGQNGGSISRS